MKKTTLLLLLFIGICQYVFAQNKAKATHKADSVSVTSVAPENSSHSPFGDSNAMAGIMNSFGPMMINMAKASMDAQIEYFKQPGKLAEVAKLTREYYNALIKEGFTEDQALKIVIADTLLPKSTYGK